MFENLQISKYRYYIAIEINKLKKIIQKSNEKCE